MNFSMTASVEYTVEQMKLLRYSHCLSAGSDLFYLQFKLTIRAQSYSRTNFTPPLQESLFPAPLRHAEKQPCHEMFFVKMLATTISGMPTPEICFLPGQLRWTLLPNEYYGDSLSSPGSNPQSTNWEVDTLLVSYRRPSETFVATVRWCYDGALLRIER